MIVIMAKKMFNILQYVPVDLLEYVNRWLSACVSMHVCLHNMYMCLLVQVYVYASICVCASMCS